MTDDNHTGSQKPGPSQEAIDALLEEAKGLPVEDILDICYTFSHDPVRLEIYLNVLRQKGSAKAQTASCLICYDLARKGSAHFELEFNTLIPVFQEYLENDSPGLPRLIDSLVGGSEYLQELLRDVEETLAFLDPREQTGPAFAANLDTVEDIEIDLLEDGDFAPDDLAFLNDDAYVQRQAWDKAFSEFIGPGGLEKALFVTERIGFFAESRADLARVKNLSREAAAVKDEVPEAQELLPLAELFLAAHMRSRNLFGRPNRDRLARLESGLEYFTALERPPSDLIAWLQSPTATSYAWDKVAEILLDYIAFLGAHEKTSAPQTPNACAVGYVFSERPQPPPPRLLEEGQGRRRR